MQINKEKFVELQKELEDNLYKYYQLTTTLNIVGNINLPYGGDVEKNVITIQNRITDLRKEMLLGLYRTEPVQPENREYNHFSVGDKVMVHLTFSGVSDWYNGTVVNGYRHHDGLVNYNLPEVHTEENESWGAGYTTPTVLLEEEYDFYYHNPDKWLPDIKLVNRHNK